MNRLMLIVLAVSLAMSASGCATSIKGGESQHVKRDDTSTGGQAVKSWSVFTLFAHPDGAIEIHADANRNATTQPTTTAKLDSIATTQPTISTNTGQMPKLGSASEGEIGSVAFVQAKANFPNAWPLALLFLGAAAGFWFLAGQRLLAIASVACAVLTLLMPTVMAFAAIGILALLGYHLWKTQSQVVDGAQAVIEGAPSTKDADVIKQTMATRHDASTKRVIASIKG